MKKTILFLLFFTFILSYSFSQDKNEEENLDIYTIPVGFHLTMLKVNDVEYFNFYDASATVLEITPIDETTCKTVISVPWNKVGSFQNYVIYLKIGDLLQIRTGRQVAVGLVGNFKYNFLPFVGLAK